jgi:hypothetical protein
MPAVKNSAPLNPVPLRQVEVVQLTLSALTFPLRRGLYYWALSSEVSRPLAALIMPSQSRETHQRPAPGAISPSHVPGGVVQLRP